MTETFAGHAALAIALDIPANMPEYARLQSPLSPPQGSSVTFHVWVAAGTMLAAVQPYVMDANYTWSGSYVPLTEILDVTLDTVQSRTVMPYSEIGTVIVAQHPV